MNDRDPVVGAALDLLDAPPAAPGFWEDLVHQFESGGPAHRGGGPVVLPLEHRSRRLTVWRTVAVAAAAAIIVVVAGLLATRSDQRVGTADGTGSSTTAATVPPPAVDVAADAARVAQTWIAAVGSGDVDAAWALVGPQSRETYGGAAGFRDLMASALREGWGAWSGATELKVTVVPLLETPGSEVEVVVLDGVVAQEGPPARTVTALAVRFDAGAGFVEPAVPGRALGLVDLLPGATVAVGAPIPVHVDDAVASVVIVDGSAVPAADVRALAGQHTLTVGMVTAQGTIALDTVSFTAA